MNIYLYLFIIVGTAWISGCSHLISSAPPLPAALIARDMQPIWQQSLTPYRGHSALNLQPYVDGRYAYVAQPNGSLCCIDWQTGTLKWQQQLADNFVTSIAAAKHALVVGGAKGQLYVIDKYRGVLLWQQSLGSEILVAPVVEGERIFIKTADAKVYAFKLKTGAQAWMYQHDPSEFVLRSMSAPLTYRDMVVVGFADGQLVALSQTSGQVRWIKTIAKATIDKRINDIAATPVLQGDRLYVATYQSGLTAIDLTRDKRYWTFDIKVHQDLLMDADSIYVVDAANTLWRLNKQSGRVMWQQEGLRHRHLSRPVLLGNKLIVTDQTGYVHVLAKSTGQIISHFQFGQTRMMADPLVVEQTVLLYGDNGLLAKYQIR